MTWTKLLKKKIEIVDKRNQKKIKEAVVTAYVHSGKLSGFCNCWATEEKKYEQQQQQRTLVKSYFTQGGLPGRNTKVFDLPTTQILQCSLASWGWGAFFLFFSATVLCILLFAVPFFLSFTTTRDWLKIFVKPHWNAATGNEGIPQMEALLFSLFSGGGGVCWEREGVCVCVNVQANKTTKKAKKGNKLGCTPFVQDYWSINHNHSIN